MTLTMIFMLSSFLILFLSLQNVFVNANSAKLNVPRVLLPIFNEFSTNFTLEVSEHGCYKWSASRLDVIQLTPLELNTYLGCSSKALVSTISKEQTRNTVIVLAEDVSSDFVLRCDIIVDVISSLNIVTTTREVFMEEAPEMFEVRAYDDQGNQFTTLEGVEFQWSIGSVSSSKGTPVLKFITFHDSPYETPSSIEKFDMLGMQGHIVLIEGITTGTARVSVALPHPEYQHVPKIEVQLSVVANLLLVPSDTYIIRGDKIKYRLLQMQHGKLEEIMLPSPQYYLEIEDTEIIRLDTEAPIVRGVKMGQTKINLRDRNVDITELGVVRLPVATITVTEPAYLTLALLPYRNWAVLVNQMCTIIVEVFNKDNHKIHIGDSVHITTTVADSYFSVKYKTNNGTVVYGQAVTVGTTRVIATLDSVKGVSVTMKFHPPISTEADMFIYPHINVIPNSVVLPWDPYRNSKYEIELKATGGDGSYWWNSANHSVASVNQAGIVRVQGMGEVKIIAAMQRNQHNQAFSDIQVLPPAHLEIMGRTLEAQVLKPIFLHIALYAETEVDEKLVRLLFSDCQNLQFHVKIWDDNFYHDTLSKTEPAEGSCGTVAVVGRKMGTTKVTVSYQFGEVTLEASTTVSAYKALEVLHPVTTTTVLSVGASRHIVWAGGPKVWFGRHAEHTTKITSSSDIITISELPRNDQTDVYVYSVLCTKLGETDVTLSVTNYPTDARYKQAKSSAIVKVICAKPRYISVQAESIGDAACPLNTDSSRVVMLSYKPVKLTVIIKDDKNRVFDNATSLYVDWALSKKTLGSVQFEGGVFLSEKTEANYVLPLSHYQVILPKNRTGTLKIVVSVVSYRRLLLKELKITPEYPNFGISNEVGYEETPLIETTLSVVFVNDTVVSPEQVTVFNHPQNKVVLKVSQGSGYYKVEQSSSEIADVRYFDSSHTVEIVPRTDGVLVITLVDLCLPSKPASAEIQVLKVGSMKVDMIERVEKSKSIIATVWLYDSIENALAVADSELLELRTHVESDIVVIKRLSNETRNGEIKFEITGVELGNTVIVFTSGHGSREIRSQPQSIQVFPPLQLVPRNITLIIGAAFQITSTGGPQPDCTLEFLSMDNSLVRVNSTGLVEGVKIGDVHVVGMAVGFKKNTATKIIYSKDSVDVHVVPLEGVKIHCPLLKIRVGSKMPIWVKGVPDKITPLILGSVQPNLLFKWSVSTPEIAELQDVLHETGVEVPDKDRISMRLITLKPGRIILNLVVTVKSGQKPWTEFSDSVELEVFEDLRLLKPPLSSDIANLLMAPDSQLQLRTNKDTVSRITYKLVGSPAVGWLNQSTALSMQGSIVKMSQDGMVTSQSALGHSTVLINTVEDNGVEQTIGMHIEVKPVQYIMLNVKTKLHLNPDNSIYALPRGLGLEFFITYHDNHGSVFTAVRTDLKMRTNRLDKVQLKRGEINGTLFASLVNYGQTMLKVWDVATPHNSEDYFKFSIDNLIRPAKNEMTVGDIVCFSMPLLNENGEPGIWSSTHSEVITMDLPSGIARARGKTGTSLITYTLSNTITASSLIEVLPIHSIMFLPSEGINLTNWGHFSAPLLLLSERDTLDKLSNLLAQDGSCHTKTYSPPSSHFPFSCEIRFNSPMTPVDIYHVFTVHPHFSIDTGLYSCRFEPVSLPSINISVILSNVTLRAISDGLVSEPLVLPFLPAVYVHKQEIHLSDKQLSTILSVTAVPQVLPQIQVYPSNAALLSLSAPDKSDSNTISFQVRVNELEWSRIDKPEVLASVFVLSPLTSQNITVPVIIRIKGDRWLTQPCLVSSVNSWSGTPSSNTLMAYSYTLTVVVSIIVIALVSIYAFVTLIQPSRTQAPTLIYEASPNFNRLRQIGGASPCLDMNSTFLYKQPFSDIEPVYGDPNLTRHSPERLPRNRR